MVTGVMAIVTVITSREKTSKMMIKSDERFVFLIDAALRFLKL